MKLTLYNLLECVDINFEILSFLSFENKINLAKCFKKLTFFKNVNLISDEYIFKKIHNMFHICLFCKISRIIKITNVIAFYLKKTIANKILDWNPKFNIKIEFYTFAFIDKTFDSVFIRHLIEFLENNNISLQLNSNFADFTSAICSENPVKCIFRNTVFGNCCQHQPNNENESIISKIINYQVQQYYEQIIQSECNIYLFCDKCGLFGHCNTSRDCLLYNPIFENIEIKTHVKNIVNYIVESVCTKK
jgi:hypothetical protein